MEVTVKFKQGVNPEEWNHLHPELHSMFETLAMIFAKCGYNLEITSMLRKKTVDSGIHETGRALDCMYRPTPQSKFVMSRDQAHKVEAFMNFIFRRPSTFRSCLFHDAGTGFHYHLQCDPTPGWVDLKGEIPKSPEPPLVA